MSETSSTFLYLCQEEVERLCLEIDSVAIMREVFALHDAGQTTLPDEAYLPWTNEYSESARSLNMPAYVGGHVQAVGTKIINGNPQNFTRGLPRASGLTLLFDPISARISCVMEGASISSLRTASVSTLAVELLQGNPIQSIAIIGAGVLAEAHLRLFIQRLPDVRTIYVYDLVARRVDTLYEHLSDALRARDLTFKAVSSAEEAIRPAQLIVPTTTTTTGYIPSSWLQPGALLVNISLDDPLPDVVFQAGLVVVDDWLLVKHDSRRLLGRMYRQGQLVGPDEELHARGQRRVDAQLGEIVNGKKQGRTSKDQVILVNPFGLAIEDIAIAHQIYLRACEDQVGIQLKR
jgi:ornithine cyclodeaminase/alanine dehydrogenase-like protein (mu-crystallin family)